MRPMRQILLVGVGGALGSIARYLLSGAIQGRPGAGLPPGTLAVNAVGSFLIVLVMHTGSARAPLSPEARLFLATGVMGGFTTYSAFNFETMRLLQTGSPALGALNVAATVVGCLLAGGAGL